MKRVSTFHDVGRKIVEQVMNFKGVVHDVIINYVVNSVYNLHKVGFLILSSGL